jgi:hypothetical protein
MPEYLSELQIREYTFTIFIEESDGVSTAYALEAGMVASDSDRETALFKLFKLLVRHVEFAEKHDRQNQIYRPTATPVDVWTRYRESSEKGIIKLLETRSRFIAFDKRPQVRLNQKTYAKVA